MICFSKQSFKKPLTGKERLANHRRSRTRIFPNLTRTFKTSQKPKSELQTEKRGFVGDCEDLAKSL
jgi:hypothetical protein